MVTIGTGVGGGIVINDELYRGVNFSAAEIGHIVIQKDGVQCNCGRKGCFEAYASASGLQNLVVLQRQIRISGQPKNNNYEIQ